MFYLLHDIRSNLINNKIYNLILIILSLNLNHFENNFNTIKATFDSCLYLFYLYSLLKSVLINQEGHFYYRKHYIYNEILKLRKILF